MEREEVLRKIEKEKVKFIQLWFVDLVGMLKTAVVPVHQLKRIIKNGIGFDGSSIEGFKKIYESDMIAKPDLSTFAILPWTPKESREARVFCDIFLPNKKQYEEDPRYILKKNLNKIKNEGYNYYVGPELEYFYFKTPLSPEVVETNNYFENIPPHFVDKLRKETAEMLEEMGIKVELLHHEVAHSQQEIHLMYNDALFMADAVITYKLVVKVVAQLNGIYASFMPKPLVDQNGSGMHVHQSIFKGKENIFFSKNGEISTFGKQFTAGLLTHAKEITLITNQWVNSYKRLVPGYEAPVYISWAKMNRSTLVRVPAFFTPNSARIEYRSPDPSCNPYFAFSCMLEAGLEGVRKKYTLPPPVEKDVYKMSWEEREAFKIDCLPETLGEAITYAKRSKIVKKVLGEKVVQKLIKNKTKMWNNYRRQVTEYEIKNYLPIL